MNLKNHFFLLFTIAVVIACNKTVENKKPSNTQVKASIKIENVVFDSEGIKLAGTIYSPEHPHSAVVIVHGSDFVPRMSKMAELLAHNDILVLTYDKRGVGESGGIYAGPEVGTNNISIENLNLLAKDASSAVDLVFKKSKDLPIGLFGASQAGWIIPIAANKNPLVKFMVLFSSPTITTLEQLRFQFYTKGRMDFWENYTEKDARQHIKNDPDKYQFEATDPKKSLKTLSISGLWIFGEKDIQIPVKMCIEHINTLKLENKPFEYVLFQSLGHNTSEKTPIDISINWIKQKSFNYRNSINKLE